MNWLRRGWEVFPAEPEVTAWAAEICGDAMRVAANMPRRHGDTWCVGVDALDSDAQGRVAGGQPFGGVAFDEAVKVTGVSRLHRAQISVTYPGYPGRGPQDSDAAHRFRRDRCAAHLDGLLPIGPLKRRFLREPHAWILGVSLTQADADAAPLVVWKGSHLFIRDAFDLAFDGVEPRDWPQVDVTDIYHAARAQVFEVCKRVHVPMTVGQTVLLHRMAIHGVAPWADGATADPAGRAMAYFRPCFEDMGDWLKPG